MSQVRVVDSEKWVLRDPNRDMGRAERLERHRERASQAAVTLLGTWLWGPRTRDAAVPLLPPGGR